MVDSVILFRKSGETRKKNKNSENFYEEKARKMLGFGEDNREKT
jgi:hypothetical protein